jgi:hypothetical protein
MSQLRGIRFHVLCGNSTGQNAMTWCHDCMGLLGSGFDDGELLCLQLSFKSVTSSILYIMTIVTALVKYLILRSPKVKVIR